MIYRQALALWMPSLEQREQLQEPTAAHEGCGGKA